MLPGGAEPSILTRVRYTCYCDGVQVVNTATATGGVRVVTTVTMSSYEIPAVSPAELRLVCSSLILHLLKVRHEVYKKFRSNYK